MLWLLQCDVFDLIIMPRNFCDSKYIEYAPEESADGLLLGDWGNKMD